MPKSRRPYPVEYRAEMVRLVRAGRGIEELSREFEPSHQDAAIGRFLLCGVYDPIAVFDGARLRVYTVPARYALAMTLVFARDLYKWNIPALLAASDMKGRGSYTGWFTMHSFLEALSNSLHSAGLKSFRRNSGTESDLRALGLWAMPLCGAAPAWLFRTVRLSEISSKKGDKFRWPTITQSAAGMRQHPRSKVWGPPSERLCSGSTSGLGTTRR